MNKIYPLWLILGAYGVWFAIFSGTEEVVNGKYWKVTLAIILAVLVYWVTRSKKN